jgi:hypothetical protein
MRPPMGNPAMQGDPRFYDPMISPTEKDEVLGNFSDSIGLDKLYNALDDYERKQEDEREDIINRRKRVNCVPLFISLFVPWLGFLLVFGLIAFYTHYCAPLLTTATCGTILLGCIQAMLSANKARVRRQSGWQYKTYIATATFATVLGGWISGDYIFWTYMQPSFHIEHLATYTDVNPSSVHLRNGIIVPSHGKRYQDAGTVYFHHNSKLDQTRATSFKSSDLYCVVPIVDPTCTKNCGTDFWAVGKNCCAEDASDFRCGQYDHHDARAGLRLMATDDTAFYRLAVLQAEGMFNLVSTHPVFFEWMHDPVHEVKAQKMMGYRRYLISMFAVFFGNAIVAAAYIKLVVLAR